MFHRLRDPEPFGKAGLTVAILALVLAVVGGAYAAGALTGKQRKEVRKIAKRYAGKRGATGATGARGKQGPKGKAGTPAEAVAFSGERTLNSVTCKEGGVEVKSAKPATLVCNGAKGGTGTTGFTETLPKGKTETGTWSVSSPKVPSSPEDRETVPISFTIPLALAPQHAWYIRPEEGQKLAEGKTGGGPGELCQGRTGTELTECEDHYKSKAADCPGTYEHPVAVEGSFCVFASIEEHLAGIIGGHIFNPQAGGTADSAGTVGAELRFASLEDGQRGLGAGTWAVTAE